MCSFLSHLVYSCSSNHQIIMTYLHSAPSGLGPLSRSPALPHPTSPIHARDLYTGATPQLRRTTDLLARSPSLPSTARGVPLSPSSTGGFGNPANMESSLNNACPPLLPTDVIYQLQTADGQLFRPEIYGRIDKGFFMADKDWTCYRRNYFSLNCSYTILPSIPNATMTLVAQTGGGATGSSVYAFAMSIAAVVDGHDGKAIELVQHTPKRDKGPQQRPDRVTLQPRQPHQHGSMYGGDNSLGGSRGLYDSPGFSQSPSQPFSNGNPPATEASYERIQFKNATANNGKRRAAQQYYHLIVELYADVGQQQSERWVKIATRISAQMVVRGRSPGHYQGERRGSNASSGPGSGGASGGGSYTPGGISRAPGDMGMGGSSSTHQGSSYGSGYDGRSHHYRSVIPPLQIPLEGMMSTEESKSITESTGYLYYPSPIYEGNESRYQAPRLSEYTTSKVKNEYPGNYLPSMNFSETLNRPCGRWEGYPESKGHFPTALLQHEMSIN